MTRRSDPAVTEQSLPRSGPTLVTDTSPGEVDDGIKALEGSFEDLTGSVVPSHHLAFCKVLG